LRIGSVAAGGNQCQQHGADKKARVFHANTLRTVINKVLNDTSRPIVQSLA
jgi:hypothetical protein